MTSAQRARVGAELRRIRLAEGLSGEDVGAALGWSQSKVSRIETGRFGVNIPDLSALLNYYGVPEEVKAELLSTAADDAGIDGAWIVRAGGTPRRQGEVQAVETQLKRFRQHHPLLVPGQLQSEEYARENAKLGGFADPEGIAKRRMARQELLERKGAPRYEVVLDARALWYWPGDRAVMRGQVEHLIERAALPAVKLRVIPFAADRSAVAMTPFIVYDFTRETSPPVVFVESQTADMYLSDPKDVQAYSALFEKLTSDALDHAESINYVASLGKEIESYPSGPEEDHVASAPDFSKAKWRKSSVSDSGGCVEVAYADGFIGVRDTKDGGVGPVLTFNRHEWTAFLGGVENSEFTLDELSK